MKNGLTHNDDPAVALANAIGLSVVACVETAAAAFDAVEAREKLRVKWRFVVDGDTPATLTIDAPGPLAAFCPPGRIFIVSDAAAGGRIANTVRAMLDAWWADFDASEAATDADADADADDLDLDDFGAGPTIDAEAVREWFTTGHVPPDVSADLAAVAVEIAEDRPDFGACAARLATLAEPLRSAWAVFLWQAADLAERRAEVATLAAELTQRDAAGAHFVAAIMPRP
jgi:hypothetical protein